MNPLRAPFPFFGGKNRAAHLIWQRFGGVVNYVEPFMGSLAVLLARPDGWTGSETGNDLDGFIANFWRAVSTDPDQVAHYANWPVNENDQHARHGWLVKQRDSLTKRLEGDPEFFDVKIAGWWVWGICCWIGSGWCSGDGPWQTDDDGQLVHVGDAGMGIHRQLVHVGSAGMGIHRQLVHVGSAGMGIHRQLVHVGDAGRGAVLREWFTALADRLRGVRVACGEWDRVLGPSSTTKHGLTGVLLDPPYADDEHAIRYGTGSADSVLSTKVRTWAIENSGPLLRIALCGYDGEHAMPDGWIAVKWKTNGGYGSQGEGRGRVNAARETIWFSPSCVKPGGQTMLALELD